MQPEQLLTLVPQGSMLGAVLFLVIVFLNHIKESDKNVTAIHKNCEDRLATIATECTEVIKENIKTLTRLEDAVKDIKPFIRS